MDNLKILLEFGLSLVTVLAAYAMLCAALYLGRKISNAFEPPEQIEGEQVKELPEGENYEIGAWAKAARDIKQ